MQSKRQFFGGILLGLLMAVLGWQLFTSSESAWIAAQTETAIHFAWYNLGSSLIFFCLNLLFYSRLYQRLNQQINNKETPSYQLMHSYTMLDYCCQASIIIGIIYTAIGMREALLYALGDSGTQQGADLLKRMVDGGILIALSSTIVGYICGQLMKIIKKIGLELRLNQRLYQEHQLIQQQQQDWQQALLTSVQQHSSTN